MCHTAEIETTVAAEEEAEVMAEVQEADLVVVAVSVVQSQLKQEKSTMSRFQRLVVRAMALPEFKGL